MGKPKDASAAAATRLAEECLRLWMCEEEKCDTVETGTSGEKAQKNLRGGVDAFRSKAFILYLNKNHSFYQAQNCS